MQQWQTITGIPCKRAYAALTSQVHLVGRCPVGFLFALVAGDGGIFEGAPIWLVTFQCQLLGPARQVDGHYCANPRLARRWGLVQGTAQLLGQLLHWETRVTREKLLPAAWGMSNPRTAPAGELHHHVLSLESLQHHQGQTGMYTHNTYT